jgi:hypothetical protein
MCMQLWSRCESPFLRPLPSAALSLQSGISTVKEHKLRHKLGMSSCMQGLFHALDLSYLSFIYQFAAHTGDQCLCQRCGQVNDTIMDTLERWSLTLVKKSSESERVFSLVYLIAHDHHITPCRKFAI